MAFNTSIALPKAVLPLTANLPNAECLNYRGSSNSSGHSRVDTGAGRNNNRASRWRVPAGMDDFATDSITQTIVAGTTEPAIHKKAPYLVVYAGRDTGKRFALREEGETTIGRGREADIVIDDERISRLHCAVVVAGKDITIEDLQSKNGTFLDGDRIEREPLALEASLQIGKTIMRLEYKDRLEIDFEDERFRNATTDPLTGVPNRHFFMCRAREELPLARRLGMPVVVAIIDVDRFKKINDSYGHLAGDYVLGQVAGLIASDKRTEDLLGRYGGDEFVVMLRGKLEKQGALAFCERVRRGVEAFNFVFDGREIPVTVSMGLCFAAPREQPDLEELIARADRVLYRAKEDGRNRVGCE